MRVLILAKEGEQSEAATPPTPEAMAEYQKFNEELVKSGVVLEAGRLHPSSQGRRVQFAGKKRTVIDGPFTAPSCGAWSYTGGASLSSGTICNGTNTAYGQIVYNGGFIHGGTIAQTIASGSVSTLFSSGADAPLSYSLATGTVATLTLNNPPLNIVTDELLEELWDLTQDFLRTRGAAAASPGGTGGFYQNTTFCNHFGRECDYWRLCAARGSELIKESFFQHRAAHEELRSEAVHGGPEASES